MFVMSAWTLYFFTTFCGLTASEAGLIFVSARLLDAFFSPVIGYVSDRFHRTKLGARFGRRRFFILLAIPLLPSFALMWMDGHGFWYYLVTYVFFELVYAMEIIPYETLAAEMSPDYKVKAKFAGARILTGQVSAILAGILPGRIIEHFGKSSAETFMYLGIIFAGLSSFVALMVYLFTWERPREEIESIAPKDSGSPLQAVAQLFKDLWATLRIRAFRLHLGMYIGGYISQDIFNAAFTYFATLALLGTVVTVSNYLGWMVGAQLISVAVCHSVVPAPPSGAYLPDRRRLLRRGTAGFPAAVEIRQHAGALGVRADDPRGPGSRRAQLHSVERLQLHGRRGRNRHRATP